jgi:hypothetical protein
MTVTSDPVTTSSTAPAPTPVTSEVPMVDLYRDIHKGIRAELFATTVQAGAADPSDRTARVQLAGRIEGLVALCSSHAEHEDRWVQPAIESVLPNVAETVVADHHSLDARISDIHEMARVVGEGGGPRARDLVSEVYLELASFTGAYLAHQDLEERVVMPALGAALGPAAVLDIHRSIVGNIPPQEMATSLALMLPAMNVDDRTELLGGIRADAPDEVFAGIWDLAASALTAGDVAAVAARLGLAS